jgi:diaminopimelate decarboxylase
LKTNFITEGVNLQMKIPFVSLEQAKKIIEQYPTPFHLYDEKGIRENARKVNRAFSWNEGFKEYFAVKATPTPGILQVLKEEGCGVDCSSFTELKIAEAVGFSGDEIMFSSNMTPAEDFVLANELGAIINFDDFTHIAYF